MSNSKTLPKDAYQDGLDAAYRSGRYEGVNETPDCPYPRDTREGDLWWDGFGDGTQDFINWQRTN